MNKKLKRNEQIQLIMNSNVLISAFGRHHRVKICRYINNLNNIISWFDLSKFINK